MDNNERVPQATTNQYEIELMKQQLVSSMSEDIEAAPKWSNQSAGQMDNNGVPQATTNQHEIELMKHQSVSSLLKDIEAALKWSNESAGASSCSIFRVPEGVAGGIAKACQPCMVSIGPYHHGESQLRTYEDHKRSSLRAMLDQTQPRGVGLKDLIDTLMPKVKMIRQCYSGSTDSLSAPDIVKMMVLDGCFIIHFLRQMAQAVPAVPPLRNLYELNSVARDLVRLENQIPYFVLEDLFEKMNVSNGASTLAGHAFNFFRSFWNVSGDVWKRQSNKNGVHLLDSLRLSLIPGDGQHICVVDETSSDHLIRSASELRRVSLIPGDGQHICVVDESSSDHLIRSALELGRVSLIPGDGQHICVVDEDESSSDHLIRSASELRRVGIGFKQRKASTFLDIYLDEKCRIIEIPQITVDDQLTFILPNMVAFEQCRGQSDGHITNYAAFMGCLLHTANDVQLLRDRKIVSSHGMSNEDVARFFGNVCKDTAIDLGSSYLAGIYEFLNKPLKYERIYLCYTLLLNAFHDNPWSALSGLAVVVTLVGIIQTIYAVLQYYHPN